MHYNIITFVILAIVFLQFKMFLSSKTKIGVFKKIFPQGKESFSLGKHTKKEDTSIVSHHSNSVLAEIINSINNYLHKNKGAVSDFHLMKDIVDRNCDSLEEEIDAQIPIPLYLGLVGTMLGILIGIGFLVFTGSLNELLDPSSASTDGEGITELFGGVALAMIASITGIILTIFGTYFAKNAKKDTEKGKNIFLSWMQAELLPELSSDTTAVLEKMTRNLQGFNETFSGNTHELRETLKTVNESYHQQTKLMQSINQLKITSLAAANIEVYEKLKNCTDEIGMFSQYLEKANDYLKGITALNHKLDDYESRTQILENAGNFFAKNEKWLADNIDSANLETKGSLRRFNEGMEASLSKIQESLGAQLLAFNSSMRSQQDLLKETLKEQNEALKGKSQEISMIVDEIKNLSAVKTSISNFESTTSIQNKKIDDLVNAIQKLTKIKTAEKPKLEIPQWEPKLEIPLWLKATIVTVGGIISVSCLAILVPLLIEWVSNLIKWLF
ncbi:hypothetical protein AwDysgo_07890 [Bacteroidales bacterium]|nr:hypothetical protein AwDysgo_07890 [Bacteroidales bacterium]